MTYAELNRYFYLKKRMKTINDELAQITYLSATLNDGMPHSTAVGDPVHAAYIKLNKLKKKREFLIVRITDELAKLDEFIDNVGDIEMQEILSQRFILCRSYEAIGNDLFMSHSTVLRKIYNFLDSTEVAQHAQ
ncbi:MAG: hypothetical protein MJ168_05475 [Clostridia bacterium]|nr:hypothetical protein [Clostridia bacterium]